MVVAEDEKNIGSRRRRAETGEGGRKEKRANRESLFQGLFVEGSAFPRIISPTSRRVLTSIALAFGEVDDELDAMLVAGFFEFRQHVAAERGLCHFALGCRGRRNLAGLCTQERQQKCDYEDGCSFHGVTCRLRLSAKVVGGRWSFLSFL
jgi:hypothetical protein